MTDPDRASTAPGTPAGPRPGPLPPLRPNRPPESPLSHTRSGYDRPPRLLAALIGRSGEVQSLSAVLLFGMLMLLAGLEVVRTTPELDFTYDGAIEGILSQLAITGPAAVLVALATTANVLAGAAALRLAGAPAFRSPTDMVLAGFTTAVILDTGTLFLLGSAGLFGWPELVLLHAAVAIGWLARRESRGPLLARPVRVRLSRPAAWWPLVLAIWAGPLIVQLASPALPFMDVLPNHVAPVEHVRVFGSFATLATSPSPIYGPSRLMLGYVALLGQLTTITNLDAVLAEAAFALPLTILMALAIRRLTARLFGSSAAFWVLLTFPLTFTFMRIPDVRGTVVVFPVAAWALIRIAEELLPRSDGRPSHPGRERPKSVDATARGRPDLSLAFALGGAFLLHPLVGLVTFAAAAGALVLYPDRLGRTLTPALGAGAVIAIPQALTMGGIGAPAWVGFVCVCLGAGAAFGLAAAVSAIADRLPPLPTVAVRWQALLLVTAIALFLQIARAHIPVPDDPASEVPNDFLRILDLCILGAVLSVFRLGRGWILLGCGIAAGVGAWAASGLVGYEGLTELAIHYEVPKSMEYWIPVMLAIGAAGALAAVLRQRWLGVLRPAAVAAFVAVVTYPITDPIALGPLVISDSRVVAPLTSNVQIGEHRGAESVGLALHEAEYGYWVPSNSAQLYPDARRIIDAPRQAVVDALRAEELAGRLGPSTTVLNIASSFQQWVSVPVGVFTGAIETSISLEPEVSIHTEGGRLLGFEDLDSELASGFGYVVLEPDGLPLDVLSAAQTQIAAAGYRQIWVNSQAAIYARP